MLEDEASETELATDSEETGTRVGTKRKASGSNSAPRYVSSIYDSSLR